MKIRVFINSDIDTEEINIENNTICLYFKSVESYIKNLDLISLYLKYLKITIMKT